MKKFLKLSNLIDMIILSFVLLTLPVFLCYWYSATNQTCWYLPLLALFLFSIPAYILIVYLISKYTDIQITDLRQERKEGTK